MITVVENCGKQMFTKLADDAYDNFFFLQLVSSEFLGYAHRSSWIWIFLLQVGGEEKKNEHENEKEKGKEKKKDEENEEEKCEEKEHKNEEFPEREGQPTCKVCIFLQFKMGFHYQYASCRFSI